MAAHQLKTVALLVLTLFAAPSLAEAGKRGFGGQSKRPRISSPSKFKVAARNYTNKARNSLVRARQGRRPGFVPPNPGFKPRPVIKPLPIIRPKPIHKPWPIIHPKPICKPWPIIIPNPVTRPRPICDPTPIIVPGPGPLPSPQPVPCPVPVVDPAPIDDAPVAHQPDLAEGSERPKVHAGQQIGLPLEGLGDEAGTVRFVVGGLSIKAKVLNWTPERVNFQVPAIDLEQPVEADLQVESAAGTIRTTKPVLLAPAESAAPPLVPVGARLTLRGDGFGQTQGEVRVRVSGLTLQASVVTWTQTATVVELPDLEVDGPTDAELLIVTTDGKVADQSKVRLVPAG